MFFEPVELCDGTFTIGFKDISFAGEEGFSYKSSYHVLPSRLLGFSFPDYLKYCSTNGATIRGAGAGKYCYPVWKTQPKCKELCNRVNNEWNKIRKVIGV